MGCMNHVLPLAAQDQIFLKASAAAKVARVVWVWAWGNSDEFSAFKSQLLGTPEELIKWNIYPLVI